MSETPLRRQRKVVNPGVAVRNPRKHLCVGREKLASGQIKPHHTETPLRRQRKDDIELSKEDIGGNTSA